MLEQEVIQYRGFRNWEENGEIVGFQVCVRSDYYRGIWLSQLRPGRVIVDGELFPWNTIIWNIDGVDYTTDEMAKRSDKFWRNSEVATLKVRKPGGLAQGAESTCQALLTGLMVYLTDLHEEYPDFVEVLEDE